MLLQHLRSAILTRIGNEIRSQRRLPVAVLISLDHLPPRRSFSTTQTALREVELSGISHSPQQWTIHSTLSDPKVVPSSLNRTPQAHRAGSRASSNGQQITSSQDHSIASRVQASTPRRRRNEERYKKRTGSEETTGEDSERRRARRNSGRYSSKRVETGFKGMSQPVRGQWEMPEGSSLHYISRPWLAYLPPTLATQHVHDYLNQEILAFQEYMKLTTLEQAAVDRALKDTRFVVCSIDPSIKMSLIGSRSTGLAMPLSDLDLNLNISQPIPRNDNSRQVASSGRPETREEIANELRLVAQKLKKKGGPNKMFYQVRLIDAKVPIVHARHAATKVEIQIQCTTDGYASADMVKEYMKQFPTLRPLFLALRQALKMRGLGEPQHSGIGSYPLIMMIVATLKFGALRFDQRDAARQLLYFLDFYTSLDLSSNGVSVEPPELFPKHWPEDMSIRGPVQVSVPEAPKLGLTSMEGPSWDPLVARHTVSRIYSNRPYLLCLQDPANPFNDLGNKALAIKHVQATFQTLKEQLKKAMESFQAYRHERAGQTEQPQFSLLEPLLAANYAGFDTERRLLQRAGAQGTKGSTLVRLVPID